MESRTLTDRSSGRFHVRAVRCRLAASVGARRTPRSLHKARGSSCISSVFRGSVWASLGESLGEDSDPCLRNVRQSHRPPASQRGLPQTACPAASPVTRRSTECPSPARGPRTQGEERSKRLLRSTWWGRRPHPRSPARTGCAEQCAESEGDPGISGSAGMVKPLRLSRRLSREVGRCTVLSGVSSGSGQPRPRQRRP